MYSVTLAAALMCIHPAEKNWTVCSTYLYGWSLENHILKKIKMTLILSSIQFMAALFFGVGLLLHGELSPTDFGWQEIPSLSCFMSGAFAAYMYSIICGTRNDKINACHPNTKYQGNNFASIQRVNSKGYIWILHIFDLCSLSDPCILRCFIIEDIQHISAVPSRTIQCSM